MKTATLTWTLVAITLSAVLQTAQAASELIGKRVVNTYDVTLYLDPEKGLAYAMKDWKFLRYSYNDRKPKISYAMDRVEADPQSTPEEPVVIQMESKTYPAELSEEEHCYAAFTEVLGRLLYYAASAKNLDDKQYFHLANVITLDKHKKPGPPGVITCTIPDHGSTSMYARGQVSVK
ncbi:MULTISPECIES: hypothetical protein [unclassified Pseudomonas]|uniref:hypothetical protein n=1 Tax=unclassified Pseudomonas TaxID=196821 RepID=UPI0011EDFE78|nr:MULTISPECIES: hypothetical protein [unclassified Pseudomonas]KAA0943352.1 hypothetical protein FQ182_25575 [Pseudomonas sp. ANT_H4]KAA0949309.1 hypothetical protein FQ186_23235 [Pseudomonas sp. ANT_H14]